MERIRIPRKSWVLVCDGAKALLLQNMGDSNALDLKVSDAQLQPHARTRDIGTDRPGRVHESLGSSRSAVQSTDWHDLGEQEFLRAVADKLDVVVREHGVRHLTLVAPPRALGVLRPRLTPAVKAVLKVEIDKDLARLTTAEIESQLSAMCRLT
jgi:protein required for attachment to host cells